MRIDVPISAQTTAGGRPLTLTTTRGSCYRVRRVLGEWQAPGEVRLYRLQVDAPGGPAVAEVAGGPHSWTLRQVWQ